jgi:hypothetical protein
LFDSASEPDRSLTAALGHVPLAVPAAGAIGVPATSDLVEPERDGHFVTLVVELTDVQSAADGVEDKQGLAHARSGNLRQALVFASRRLATSRYRLIAMR